MAARLLSVLDIVSRAALEIGITQERLQSIVSTQDQDVTQMRALLYQVADEVLLEEPYVTTLGDGGWLVSSSGEPLDSIVADDDLVMFDARLAIIGIKFRFLKAKGLEFGEELRDFITRLNKLASRVNGKVIDLDQAEGREI